MSGADGLRWASKGRGVVDGKMRVGGGLRVTWKKDEEERKASALLFTRGACY